MLQSRDIRIKRRQQMTGKTYKIKGVVSFCLEAHLHARRGTPDQLLLLRKHFRKQNRPKCLRKTLLFKKINSNVNFLSSKVYAKVYWIIVLRIRIGAVMVRSFRVPHPGYVPCVLGNNPSFKAKNAMIAK